MFSRAVTFGTNRGDHQEWSTIYSYTLTVFVFVFLVVTVSSLWAQTSTTGAIAGVVTDPTAAVVPGVSITLKNVDTGSSASTTSNAQGSYNFPLLSPGNYSVSANGTGFKGTTKNVTVALGASVTANLELSISSQKETVEVTEEVTGVQTEDANIETNFNAQQISALPNPGNDLSAVALTAPGVVMNTTGGSVFGGGNYEFFGLPSNSNVFTYDGANDNDPYFNINNSGATNLTLGLNDVQETSVVTNGYSGQFGGLAGANINYVSKSGTNAFHGNAEYWWNGRALNSNNYFRNQAPEWQSQLSETHTFRTNKVNNFIASLQWYSALFTMVNPTAEFQTLPQTVAFGDNSLFNLNNDGTAFPQGRNVTQYGLVDDFSWTRGKHSFRFGVNFRRDDVSDHNFTGVIPFVQESTLNDFAFGGVAPVPPGGTPGGSILSQNFPLNTNVPIALYQLGWYASDEFKVTSNLKLTLSMRFDHLSNPACQTNCFQSLSGSFDNLNRTAPVNQALTTGLHTAFPSVTSIVYQPKVGFAWSPFGARNTVVRGGFGIFSDAIPTGGIDDILTNAPN